MEEDIQQQERITTMLPSTTDLQNCSVHPGSILIESVNLTSVAFIIPCVLLACLNVTVIFGNSLVIAAVFTSQKLRTPTHTFIVSLALADLCVGLLVLPFSNANEVLKYWIFGHIWCSVWLAVDVWLCTASILNLCAISLDRYLAISRPFKYHDLMSPKRSKILVAAVWVISFVICFPPLIGWNERGSPPGEQRIRHARTGDSYIGSGGSDPGSGFALDDGDYDSRIYVVQFPFSNYSGAGSGVAYLPFNDTGGSGMDESFQEHDDCPKPYPQCLLTSEPGYIIYSALGSFYIPMCIMAFFYWKIYRAAVSTNKAIKRGTIVTKTGSEINSSTEEKSVTLRVHRGGSANSKSYSTTALYSSKSSIREPSFSTIIESELSSTNGLTRSNSGSGLNQFNNRTRHKNLKNDERNNWRTQSARVRLENTEIPASSPLLGGGTKRKKSKQHNQVPSTRNRPHVHRFKSSDSIRGSVILEDPSSVMSTTSMSMSDSVVDDNKHTTLLKKLGKHNLKNHIRKINKEKKAAKTVGIIVGCFILCWFPFFTCYLIGAFCDDCTPQLVFSIFFWLGYCNSAINPCVYALFSKDFRYAFKKLLSCRCEKTTFRGRSRPLSMLLSFKLQSSSRGSDSNSE